MKGSLIPIYALEPYSGCPYKNRAQVNKGKWKFPNLWAITEKI